MNQRTVPVYDTPESWQAVRRGDPDALEWLCETWLPTTLQWCRRLGGPRVDADQATQDVFVVVLRRVHTVRSAGQFPSWLFSVTRRVLAQHRRRAWPNRWDASAAVDERDGGARPDEAAMSADTVRQVQEILMALPDPLREALVLCDVEQRSDPEAAAILDIPTGTVKSRLRRAREAFRAAARARRLVPSETP